MDKEKLTEDIKKSKVKDKVASLLISSMNENQKQKLMESFEERYKHHPKYLELRDEIRARIGFKD